MVHIFAESRGDCNWEAVLCLLNINGQRID